LSLITGEIMGKRFTEEALYEIQLKD
jgi:hypothetical protein